jgi:replicative DNA helicase
MGRIISSEARAPIRTADDVRDNITALQQAALRIISLPLYIDDTPRLTISEMRTRAIEMQAKHAIKFIVVDYVQIMKGEGQGKGSNREQELAGISKGLKAMAKELGLPILVLAQLNRQAEGKERPNLSQLRESGQLESDADVVAFIHRDRQAQQVIDPGESVPVDIIIEKNRSGRCGVVKLSFVPDFCLFQDEVHSFHEKDSL